MEYQEFKKRQNNKREERRNTGMSWFALTDEFKDTRKDLFYNMPFTKTGMSWFALTDEFKDTRKDLFYNMPFTKNEQYYISKRELSESDIKDWHFYLKRNLTIKELMILELCSKNAILLSENDFKRK